MGKLKPRKTAKRPRVKPARTKQVKAVATSRAQLIADLHRLREEIIKSGVPLLDIDGVRAEVRANRGGYSEDDE